MGMNSQAKPSAAGQPPHLSDGGGFRGDEQRRAADERDAVADEREAIADEREAAADERETLANARHDYLAAQERDLDARLRAAGQAAPSSQQRSYERIEQAQALLGASHERLARSLAALRRSGAAETREQRAADREPDLPGARTTAHGPEAAADLQAWVDRLREQASAAAETLAAGEDALAHACLAQHRPQQAAEHQRNAAQARTAVSVLRALSQPRRDDDGTTPLPRSPA
ncbi:hypothetical protein [Streptomyces sp. NPDC055060]